MTDTISRAEAIMRAFKGDNYTYGFDVLDKVGEFASDLLKDKTHKNVLFVGRLSSSWFPQYMDKALSALESRGLKIVDKIQGAKPNAPTEDVYRILESIKNTGADLVVVMDSGSGIDSVKAAAVLAAFGDEYPDINTFFGVGKVTEITRKLNRNIMPILPVMTASGSGAHLTKYSNITDMALGQKKLIVDEAIIPPKAVFDFGVTASQPKSLTLDGALDGVSHLLEVYYGAQGETEAKARELTEVGLDLLISGLKAYKENSSNLESRRLLGLGTDLGAYAIMIGGTNGAHLNSFSLVDVLSHGRACAIMNPYYTVFFAPAIEEKLRVIGDVYRKHGFIDKALETLSGRDLGIAVAEGMVNLEESIGFPSKLADVPGISTEHIDRCLKAAKDPQLEMKLLNMPVPLKAADVDEKMGSVLKAAWSGDFNLITRM